MVSIKVRNSKNELIEVVGSEEHPITIRTSGSNAAAVYASVDNDGLTLSSVAADYMDWYNTFLETKRNAMLYGGSHVDGYYSFNQGLLKTYIATKIEEDKVIPYIKTLAGCPPRKGGAISILGDKHLTIYPPTNEQLNITQEGKLLLGTFKRERILCKLLSEVYIFSWMLYHAYNFLNTRLVYLNPEKQDTAFNCLEYCGGTLLEYQAQVAMYNHTVWQSSCLCNIDTVVEKVSIGVGYAEQECSNHGVLIVVTIAQGSGGIGDTADEDVREAWNALTIFRSGKTTRAHSQQIDTSEISAAVRIVKQNACTAPGVYEDKPLGGTGFDKAPEDSEDTEDTLKANPWTAIKIAVLIDKLQRNQSYFEVFSLAIGTGTLKNLQLPELIANSATFAVDVTVDWYKLNEGASASVRSELDKEDWHKTINEAAERYSNTHISKATTAYPLAVNVEKDEEKESEEGEE